jgi:hypothetical protein
MVSVSRNQIRPWLASLALLPLSHHPEICCRISPAVFSRSSAKFQLIIQNKQTTKIPINYLSDSRKNNTLRKADSCSTYQKIPPILRNLKLHCRLICVHHLRWTLSMTVVLINAINWPMILCFRRALSPLEYTYVWHENSITIVLMS